jgi:hypothetical protein
MTPGVLAMDKQDWRRSLPAAGLVAVRRGRPGRPAVGVFLGWRPLLLGRDPTLTKMAFAAGGFLLVLAVYIDTSMRPLR